MDLIVDVVVDLIVDVAVVDLIVDVAVEGTTVVVVFVRKVLSPLREIYYPMKSVELI